MVGVLQSAMAFLAPDIVRAIQPVGLRVFPTIRRN